MAISVEASGTQTAVIGTEHTLATIAGPGVYVANVDLSAMAAGDVVELRIKKPVLSAGTARAQFYAMYTDAQPADDILKTSVPFLVDAIAGGCVVTLKQTTGTGRSFPYSILKMS
jgi:hypothetical protein